MTAICSSRPAGPPPSTRSTARRARSHGVLAGRRATSPWVRERGPTTSTTPAATPASSAIRTSGTKYVEYAGGKRELYFLGHDPYELRNKYPAAKPSAGLVSRLHALRTCAGGGCRAAENGQKSTKP